MIAGPRPMCYVIYARIRVEGRGPAACGPHAAWAVGAGWWWWWWWASWVGMPAQLLCQLLSPAAPHATCHTGVLDCLLFLMRGGGALNCGAFFSLRAGVHSLRASCGPWVFVCELLRVFFVFSSEKRAKQSDADVGCLSAPQSADLGGTGPLPPPKPTAPALPSESGGPACGPRLVAPGSRTGRPGSRAGAPGSRAQQVRPGRPSVREVSRRLVTARSNLVSTYYTSDSFAMDIRGAEGRCSICQGNGG
jgi:hypothetical protein